MGNLCNYRFRSLKSWSQVTLLIGRGSLFYMPSSRGLVYPLRPLLSTPGASTETPVPMGPQTCWKSCGTLPWRSWTLLVAGKFHQLRGRSCAVPAGPIWEKQTLKRASSCKLGCNVWPVRIDAVFFFSNVKGHCHGCFFDNIWQHWKAKTVKQTVANGETYKSQLQEERQQIAILLSPQSPLEHSRCFHKDTSADGAVDLLEVLRNSPLEKLNFHGCLQIPSTAWQRVPSGAWPALGRAPGIPTEELRRIRGRDV